MLTIHPRRRGREEGAVAIVVAVLTLTLFGSAAIAVDLGNAFARKRDLQSQADFAALAGGSLLPGNDVGVYSTVANYLNSNQPQNDTGAECTASKTCVTPDQLHDGSADNGEVYLEEDSVRVVAPKALVQFGLANALGFDNMSVNADATVQIFTPGMGVMPAYAVSSCSWGTQTLTDPANGLGPDAPTATGLAFPDDTNSANIDDIVTPASPFTPTAPGVDGPVFALQGDNFVDSATNDNAKWITKIGWFKDDGSPPVTMPVHTDRTAIYVSATSIPSSVASVEGLYWVRVFQEHKNGNHTAEGRWSPMDEAVPFRVGNILLQCNTGSNEGNFGVIELPRNDPNEPSLWLASNIAALLDPPLDLKAWPAGPAVCRPPGGPTATGAIISDLSGPTPTGLLPNTNCVDTDTGLPANAATAGLITGVKDGNTILFPGRLDTDTTEDCAPDGGSSRYTTPINRNPGSGQYQINDDILTCYFDDAALAEIQTLYGRTVTVGDVSAGPADPDAPVESAYPWPGKPVFSDKIFSSPRFFWVPVFRDDASAGGSNYYSIIDFRPAFITGQVAESTKADPRVDMPDNNPEQTRNGLRIKSGSVIAMKVVFLNYAAFPNAADGSPVTGYLGVGPTAVRLVD